jgi:hypothetical protein
LTYIFTATYRPSTNVFSGGDFASAVETYGSRSAMNNADLIKIGAVSYVAILQAM